MSYRFLLYIHMDFLISSLKTNNPPKTFFVFIYFSMGRAYPSSQVACMHAKGTCNSTMKWCASLQRDKVIEGSIVNLCRECSLPYSVSYKTWGYSVITLWHHLYHISESEFF